MNYLILAGKAVLVLAVIPGLLGTYIQKARISTAGRLNKWSYGNKYFWFLLIAVAAGVGGELYSFSTGQPRADTHDPLTFLSLRAYENELTAVSSAGMATTPPDRNQLLRKFEHAEYAWHSGDYREAASSLMSLRSGKDDVGQLPKIPSAIISNNLGCIYFKLQRNQGFLSFTYLHEAQTLAGANHPNRSAIDENIQKLDRLVNSLD